jgi:hypothetical protein
MRAIPGGRANRHRWQRVYTHRTAMPEHRMALQRSNERYPAGFGGADRHRRFRDYRASGRRTPLRDHSTADGAYVRRGRRCAPETRPRPGATSGGAAARDDQPPHPASSNRKTAVKLPFRDPPGSTFLVTAALGGRQLPQSGPLPGLYPNALPLPATTLGGGVGEISLLPIVGPSYCPARRAAFGLRRRGGVERVMLITEGMKCSATS